MLLIRTEALKTGMVLGKSVMLSNGRILLTAGTVMRDSFRDPLLRQGIASVYMVNDLAPDVIPADVISDAARNNLTTELDAILSEVATTFTTATKKGVSQFSVGLDTARLSQAVQKVVDDILKNPRVVYNLQDIRTSDNYTLGHSVNVCILSTLLGSVMEYNRMELNDLATGAVLHDMGKMAVPMEILNKPGKLTEEETAIMNQHAEFGWHILREQRNIKSTSAIIALQHHERWLGGGYPNGLRGEHIYKFARVCAVADCYDAMTADRVYRKGMSPLQALDTMQREMTTFFQPDLLWSFSQCIAPYPVGAMVELADGHQAVVVAVNRGKTERPRIRLLVDPSGAVLSNGDEIELEEYPDVAIVHLIRDEGDPLEF